MQPGGLSRPAPTNTAHMITDSCRLTQGFTQIHEKILARMDHMFGTQIKETKKYKSKWVCIDMLSTSTDQNFLQMRKNTTNC